MDLGNVEASDLVNVGIDVAKAAAEGAIDEMESRLNDMVQDQLSTLTEAKEEYVKLIGGEQPSLAELQEFIKFKNKAITDARQELGVRDPRKPIEKPNVTRYPYEEWNLRGACCIFPCCAVCPGVFTCPIQCPCCFPLTLCGLCKNPPLGLPKYNPLCAVTYLCKPLSLVLSKPCLVIHPCKLPCCNPCCCSLPSFGCKTIGMDCKCCHCTFTCCPSCCPTPCCAKEKFTAELHVTRKDVPGGGAPQSVQMDRNDNAFAREIMNKARAMRAPRLPALPAKRGRNP